MKGKVPGVPKLMFGFVDVRDVAEAHLKAIRADNIEGKRIILMQESRWLIDIILALRIEFKPLGYKIPKRVIGKCPIKFASFFDPQIKMALPFINE
jgi:dihydroflavonol-4-reductase